jgi:peptidoglycan/LPS O-acetylase OafA/YrhL
MPSSGSIASRRQNGFDSLRLLLAMLVIFSHSFPLTLGNNAREPLARLAAAPLVKDDELTLGGVAVWGFFVISGFLITKSWLRDPSLWRYMKKRFLRIYPGFLVAISLCALLQAALAAPGTARFPGLWDFLSHSLRLQMFDRVSIFASNPAPLVINGSLWSISYEFWCYIGVVFLGVTGLLRSRSAIAFLCAVVMASHAWIDYRHWLPGGMLAGKIFGYPLFWTRLLPFFLAGAFFAVTETRVQLKASYAFLSAVLVLAAIPFPYLPTSCGRVSDRTSASMSPSAGLWFF